MRTDQLTLKLKRRGWQQAGPGRPRGKNPKVAHARRVKVTKNTPVHVTVKVKKDVPRLRIGRFIRAFRQMLLFCCVRPGFNVVHYSIQHNHVHLLIEADDNAALTNGMKSLSARMALGINRIFGRSGPVLHGRFHMRRLRTPSEVRRALNYVLQNHRHHCHQRGESTRPGIDPASSGVWFDGWLEGSPLPPNRKKEVASPGSWLLNVGWKRHHPRISIAEVPG